MASVRKKSTSTASTSTNWANASQVAKIKNKYALRRRLKFTVKSAKLLAFFHVLFLEKLVKKLKSDPSANVFALANSPSDS
uniref:Ribosomal protein L32 n=1 Tax=Romanomermis culicivorax TaxID=13658 RepID=A0A915ISA8_ROMCU